MSIANQFDGAICAHDEHKATIRHAIDLAPNDLESALTVDVLKAFAALASNPVTLVAYSTLSTAFLKAAKSVRRADLDRAIKPYTPMTRNAVEGRTLDDFRDIDPWSEPAEGAAIADEIAVTIARYCVLPVGGVTAVTLWVMAAYAIDAFRVFPKLLLHSPQKRCGKTRLLAVLTALLPKPLIGSNVTAAVIFRAIEAWGVSVLLDEVDTFIYGNDELRGIVNSGHTAESAYVWRVDGDTVREPVRYSTWAPMVLAMIGNPAGTIFDRSVAIRLERKKTADRVSRIPRTLTESSLKLRRQCKRWADDNFDALADSMPDLPDIDNDRAFDNWSTLAAVADLIGGNWPTKARRAFQLSTSKTAEDVNDLSIELLTDIREVFAAECSPSRMFSEQLVEKLLELKDRPWAEVKHDRPLSTNKLARLLGPYGIHPKTIRIGNENLKGYERDAFADVFERYLPAEPTVTPSQASLQVAPTNSATMTRVNDVTVANPLEASRNAGCDGVTVVDRGTTGQLPATGTEGLL